MENCPIVVIENRNPKYILIEFSIGIIIVELFQREYYTQAGKGHGEDVIQNTEGDEQILIGLFKFLFS